MLTRSKKKRTTRKDKSCPQNSNQENSSDLGNDAVEVGEMVTMGHLGGTSGGPVNDCQPIDYPQVAWLLREKLNDFVDGDKPDEFPDLRLQCLLGIAALSNFVSVDPKTLNPIIWRTLPKELLLLALARLPVPNITRLRSLSREWRTDLATANSDINQACQEARPCMVALLSQTSGDAFFVTVFDITTGRWQYEYLLHLQRTWNVDWQPFDSLLTWTGMDACDGGLVCFISLRKPSKEDRLCIVVVNLLTRVQHELPPPHYQYSLLPELVQIQVDSDTKCYKVFVAAHLRGRVTVEVYDSATKQWSRAGLAPPSGSIFGPVRYWSSANGWCSQVVGILGKYGGYDFGEKKMEHFRKDIPSTQGSVFDSVLMKDRVFLLEEQSSMAAATTSSSRPRLVVVITEHHLDNQTKAWVHSKTYKCPDIEDLLWPKKVAGVMGLCACDGFLMVIVYRCRKSPIFWLLDLSTVEWSLLPEISTSVGLHKPEAVLCRAFWNVVP